MLEFECVCVRTTRDTSSSAERVRGRRDSLEMLNLFYSPNSMPMMPFYVLPPSCQQLDESLPNEVLSLDASSAAAAANAQHACLNAYPPTQVRTLPSLHCTPLPCVVTSLVDFDCSLPCIQLLGASYCFTPAARLLLGIGLSR